MHDFCFTIPYGLILVCGGVIGFAKKGSTASLGGGVGTGFLILLAGYLSLNAFHKHKNSYFALFLQTEITPFLTMVETIEAVKGGGGSIKLGVRGTISTLISRELESSSKAPLAPSTSSYNEAANNTPRKLKLITSASSIQTSNVVEDNYNSKKPETPRMTNKSESHHRIPMLGISLDGTPVRTKPLVKKKKVVQVVDIKCGTSDKKWVN